MAALPAFKNIASKTGGFNLRAKDSRRGSPYPGMVVASRDALYFAVNRARIMENAAVLGGATGGLLAGFISAKLMGGDKKQFVPGGAVTVQEIDLQQLPQEIVAHPDWPITWNEGPVIVAPRPSVKKIQTSLLLGGIVATFEEFTAHVYSPFLKRKEMAEYLVKSGWKVAGL